MKKKNLFNRTLEIIKIQDRLLIQIDECLQDEDFSRLSASMIYQMLDKSDREKIDSYLLFTIIDKSIDRLFILFHFVDLESLSDENIQKLLFDFTKSKKEETTKKYYQYLPVNLACIISLRNKNKDLQKRIDEKENEEQRKINEMKGENSQFKSKINEISEENKQQSNKLKENEFENNEIKNKIRNFKMKSI